MVEKTKKSIPSYDNTDLHTYIWKDNTKEIKRIVIICHGMAEHIERYDEFATKLANENTLVVGYNQRGHKDTTPKENYGYMGEEDNFEYLVNDLNFIVHKIKKDYNYPIIIFGHSMGSFVATRFSEIHGRDIQGLVLSGAGKNSNLLLSVAYALANITILFKGRKYHSKMMDSLCFKSFNKPFYPSRTDYDWLNTNDTEVDKYINDEYCGGIFSTAYFKDFFKGCIKISNNIRKVPNIPILFVSGEHDAVGNMTKGVKKIITKLQRTNHQKVVYKFFENSRHEILLEKDKANIHDYIINTIKTWA